MAIIQDKINAVLSGKVDAKHLKTFENMVINSYIFGNNNVSLFALAKVTDKKFVALITKELQKTDLFIFDIKSNFASMKFNDECLTIAELNMLDSIKFEELLNKYTLKLDKQEYSDSLAKANKKIVDGYIKRPGFQKQAKTEFSFDNKYLEKYQREIKALAKKGLAKQLSKGKLGDKFFNNPANYGRIVDAIIDYYISNPNAKYNSEFNISDSRGRAIFQSLNKVLNPITYTVGRALLSFDSVEYSVNDTDTLDAIYYFISTELSLKADTVPELIDLAKQAYKNKIIPELKDDLKNLNTIIHLERIYGGLDALYKFKTVQWDIPIEVDARASVLQFYGLITGDRKILERVSIVGSKITDPWNIQGVKRDVVKAIFTPYLYGSGATFENLVKNKDENLEFTSDEKKACVTEMGNGAFSVANTLKNILIKTSNVCTPKFEVNINNEVFTVPVNKFAVAKTKPSILKVWNTKHYEWNYTTINEPIFAPDYDKFKTFLATLLVHNLDSQAMNSICEKYDGIIPIHDAVITLPHQANDIRDYYAEYIESIYNNRDDILRKYLRSIGATGIATKSQLLKLRKMITPLEEDDVFNPHCMK